MLNCYLSQEGRPALKIGHIASMSIIFLWTYLAKLAYLAYGANGDKKCVVVVINAKGQKPL